MKHMIKPQYILTLVISLISLTFIYFYIDISKLPNFAGDTFSSADTSVSTTTTSTNTFLPADTIEAEEIGANDSSADDSLKTDTNDSDELQTEISTNGYTHTAIYIISTPYPGTNNIYEKFTSIVKKKGIDILIGCFKPDCTNGITTGDGLYIKYIPGTTWTSGRNMLLQEILEIEKKEKKRYHYLIFLDNDFWPKIEPNTEKFPEVWQQHQTECQLDLQSKRAAFDYFECLLLQYEPPIAAPFLLAHSAQNFWGEPVFSTAYLDAACNAFHREALQILLPYITQFDSQSWWISQAILLNRMLCLHGSPLQFDWIRWDLSVSPNGHVDYPRSDASFDIAKENQKNYLPSYMQGIDVNADNLDRHGSLSPNVEKGKWWSALVSEECKKPWIDKLEHLGYDGKSNE